MKALSNLDFVRSIAVLLVVSAHVLLYTGHAQSDGWSGITGVCIFFVHTSLVLMWSLERDPYLWRFYLRRIFRIYPLWLVVLFLTIAVRLPISPAFAPEFRFYGPAPKELLENIFLVFNLKSGARVVGASWSLPIEVQMYLLLPALFAFAQRFQSLAGLLLLDLFAMVYAWRTLPALNSSLVMCVSYFLPGIMAYVLMKRKGLKRIPSWLFPLWLLILIAWGHEYGSYRMSGFFCLALGVSLPFFREMTWKPVTLVSFQIAKYSYGIYLGHMAAIVIGVHLLRNQPLALRAAAFLCSLAILPVIFYHAVEDPMIRFGTRLSRRIAGRPSPPMTEAAMHAEPAP